MVSSLASFSTRSTYRTFNLSIILANPTHQTPFKGLVGIVCILTIPIKFIFLLLWLLNHNFAARSSEQMRSISNLCFQYLSMVFTSQKGNFVLSSSSSSGMVSACSPDLRNWRCMGCQVSTQTLGCCFIQVPNGASS